MLGQVISKVCCCGCHVHEDLLVLLRQPLPLSVAKTINSQTWRDQEPAFYLSTLVRFLRLDSLLTEAIAGFLFCRRAARRGSSLLRALSLVDCAYLRTRLDVGCACMWAFCLLTLHLDLSRTCIISTKYALGGVNGERRCAIAFKKIEVAPTLRTSSERNHHYCSCPLMSWHPTLAGCCSSFQLFAHKHCRLSTKAWRSQPYSKVECRVSHLHRRSVARYRLD